jgi:hypothetical protein
MNNPRISELLVETKAYRDLEEPVILTSGQLGIYYINTERLVQDNGEYEKYGDSSQAMIAHAIKMTQEHPTFDEVIQILVNDAKRLLPDLGKRPCAISGGQRRDWLFSGPVAKRLDIPHLSLFKSGSIEIITPDGKSYHYTDVQDKGYEALHIADLLTEASSCYRTEEGSEEGWIPMLRELNVTITNLLAVVTRKQGGEENLARQDIQANSEVAIDRFFLREHSKNPSRAESYSINPDAWTTDYLHQYGALALVDTFDPNAGKIERAMKFLNRYKYVLKHIAGRFEELDKEVQSKFGISLESLVQEE